MSEQSTLLWVPDDEQVFVQAELLRTCIVEQKLHKTEQQMAVVRLLDKGQEVQFPVSEVVPVNPTAFDKVEDMSELTHLNEPSVLYNLENRYKDGLIYTYSGLFLVAINPYCDVALYSQDRIRSYHESSKDSAMPPHIFAIAEKAYQNILKSKQNQSILVTGESGAGKTENTKKILQYLASITMLDETTATNSSKSSLPSANSESFEMKILQSNPILESFGNAQTVRNNNSSRFGKFIKVGFNENGEINGAHIDWYLLEKSRVTNQHHAERNYHIFYQLLASLSSQELRQVTNGKTSILELDSDSIRDYKYLANSNASIPGVDDYQDFQKLLSAFKMVGISNEEVCSYLKTISIILHIGNIEFVSNRSDQATIKNDISRLCDLLGVAEKDFKAAILKPKSKAGKEWISQSKNAVQARFILNALSKRLYEDLFSQIVTKINKNLGYGSLTTNYIGLLDIAGFEIFENNSFEQLSINYTNEKLQQFFNHHMFILEQNEYMKENIQWDYINYGKDLQSTIDLIESKGPPTGVLPLLDEESILQKSTDASFYSKLIATWDQKSPKFKRSKNAASFILKHYAGDVEYNTDEWLSKNKDPLSENIIAVLSKSSNLLISSFFHNENSNGKGRSAAFGTASSRHREQLQELLKTLSSTDPHFVRCIIPNSTKQPKLFDRKLILDQLRCNGVLEGIRIAREGYPNRVLFKDFYQRYRILLSTKYAFTKDSKKNCEFLISSLRLEPNVYKVGNTKLFFKAGILADIEAKKEEVLAKLVSQFNWQVRGSMARLRTKAALSKLVATRVIGETFRTYNKLMNNPWYNLYTKIRPLANSSEDITKTKKFSEKLKALTEELNTVKESNKSLRSTNANTEKELESVRSMLAKETEQLKNAERLLETSNTNKKKLHEELEQVRELTKTLENEKETLQRRHEETEKSLSLIKLQSEEGHQNLDELNSENSRLLSQIESISKQIKETQNECKKLRDNETLLKTQISEYKKQHAAKDSEIKTLKQKLNASGSELDIKIVTLEKNCNAALTRLKTVIQENSDSRSQISVLSNEKEQLEKQIRSREAEVTRVKDRLTKQDANIASLIAQRDDAFKKQAELTQQLQEVKEINSQLSSKYESLKKEYECYKNTVDNFKSPKMQAKLEDLETRLSRELSLNNYLNQKLSKSSNHTIGSIENAQDTATIIEKYDEIKAKMDSLTSKLELEVEEKKKLVSKLRFTETKLASYSFDAQTAQAQVNKLKLLIKSSNVSVDLEKELGDTHLSEVNVEKLILEVQHLQRQLEVEVKARVEAEKIASALHDKFSKIQRSDSSSDIYKLKYEANEEKVRALENKLKHLPLKERTNVPGDIFLNKGSMSKYQDEIRFHKLENYKLQEVLNDSEKKISNLTHAIKQGNLKQALLSEQIERLQQNILSTERRNETLTLSMKEQKELYETCLNDLHANESQLQEYTHALKQAEEDVKNMAAVIEKLKVQNKQKDRLIWERETERNDLDMQLQEVTLELKKVEDSNTLLKSDLKHLKERLVAVEDNSRDIQEIEELQNRINEYQTVETSLKKEMSTLKYNLETLENDFELKMGEVIKERNHYLALAEKLSKERDLIEASEQDLTKRHQLLNSKSESLSERIDTLLKEKGELEDNMAKLSETLAVCTNQNESLMLGKIELEKQIEYLKETLQFNQDQNKRNEELVKSLQQSLEQSRTAYNDEKHKTISLEEDLTSMQNKNSQITSEINRLRTQLADTTEKEAWLNKINELEALATKETEAKYEEIKKNKALERTIQELEAHNSQQTQVINMANTNRGNFEENALQYMERIEQLEKYISKQDVDLKRVLRENTYHQDRIAKLDKEAEFWKQRYNALSAGKAELDASEMEEALI